MTDTWTCPNCGEKWPNRESKVPGGCMQCIDLLRYIEYEAPGMGVVENDPSEVVCFNDSCGERVEVHPGTLVVEDDDAISVESETTDMETGTKTGAVRIEIYCSRECRNEQYSITDSERGELVQ